MLATRTLNDAMLGLLAADAATLAAATPFNAVALVKSNTTKMDTLQLSDLTLATFTGSTPLHCASALNVTYQDPITGLYTAQLREPAGGWTWVCTVAPTAPGETIYGWALLDPTLATLMAYERFDAVGLTLPGQGVLIQNIGDAVAVPYARLQLVSGSLQ